MKSFLSGRTGSGLPDAPSSVESEVVSGLSLLSTVIPVQPLTKAGASSVNCVREGGVIKKLIVTCECGKTVQIDCEYNTGAV